MTALDRQIMVITVPKAPGSRTAMRKWPMPSTKGVYNPSGISRAEKLIPGAIMLKARQKPQKKYQPKFGESESCVSLKINKII